MKHTLLILEITFLLAIVAKSQTPIFWQRADNLDANQRIWRDVSRNQTRENNSERENNNFSDINENRASNDAELINFRENLQIESMNYNPSLRVSDSAKIIINSISTVSDKITVMIVYQTNDTVREQNIWQIGDSTTTGRAGQSTQKIYDNYGAISFQENNPTISIVSTQTQKIRRLDNEEYILKIGNTEELPFDGIISEILLFSGEKHEIITKTWESYLAINMA